jgi:hypothetical protein
VVVQRSRARGVFRIAVDREGVFVGASLTVVAPPVGGVPVDAIHALLASPAVEGWLRLRHGRVTDLTPPVLSGIPFPKAWLTGSSGPLAAAWGVGEQALASLEARGKR